MNVTVSAASPAAMFGAISGIQRSEVIRGIHGAT
jgi:hypothetical protein